MPPQARLFGRPVVYEKGLPVTAPRTIPVSGLAVVGAILVGMALIVLGVWHRFGWDAGLPVLGLCLIVAAGPMEKWYAPKGQQ